MTDVAVAAPDPRAILREVFGYTDFRGLQGDVVEHVTAGRDALVLMPTGAGKSLCYQIPAIARHRAGLGVTVVVSPLIALMHDQVGALAEAGVPAAFLNSTLDATDARQVERDVDAGRLVLLYVAPERLVMPRMLDQLDALAARGKLALFAIDEAHCVSQWGHDFREDYLALGLLAERYGQVPRVALTATADAHTRVDIVQRLALDGADARVFVSSFDRPNIRYRVVEKDDARRQLLRFIDDGHAGEAGIVYCQTRKRVDETAQALVDAGITALPYHAGLDAAVRQRHQDRFLREDGIVMVATIAFGMGIDKPDVRFVAHLDLPKNIEAWYQETGRAGRDGLPAEAWMTYGLQDVVNQRRMIDESPAEDAFKWRQRAKLDALLGLAEAHDCRRVRLLAYFDEASRPCGNCDNCLDPPQVVDVTEDARKLLSCIWRFTRHDGGPRAFGAGHLIDVLRGKATDKVVQYGHTSLTTFGVGADRSEADWRGLLRNLVATGHVVAEGEWNTLVLTESARAVLKGEVPVMQRVTLATPKGRGDRRRTAGGATTGPADLDDESRERFAALKAWRSGVAKEHGLPAYVIFHDATLAEIARQAPDSLAALSSISGVGAKKLDAYGAQILRTLGG